MYENNISSIYNIISICTETSNILSYIRNNSLFITNDYYVYISNNGNITLSPLSIDINETILDYNEYYGRLSNIYIDKNISSWFNEKSIVSNINSNIITIRNKNENTKHINLEYITNYNNINMLSINTMSFLAYNYFLSNNIAFPSSINKIDKYTFSNSIINDIYIPQSVEYISQYAFNSSSISNIIFNSDIKYLDKYVFNNCHNITKLDFSNTLLILFNNSVCNCSSLTSIEFSNFIQDIDVTDLSTCINLKTIIFNNINNLQIKNINDISILLNMYNINIEFN